MEYGRAFPSDFVPIDLAIIFFLGLACGTSPGTLKKGGTSAKVPNEMGVGLPDKCPGGMGNESFLPLFMV